MDNFLNKFLNFDKMVTPTIIKVLFWIGVGISVLGGLINIIRGATSQYFGSGLMVLTGILMIVLGPILIRVYCEILIVLFKMHEALQKLADKADKHD